MSTLPPPSRRVLSALDVGSFVTIDANGRASSPVARSWFVLDAALDAHVAALAELDRREEAIVAAHGYPRVRLPTQPGLALDYAADAATIDRRVPDRAKARRLKAELHRRQRLYADVASTAGRGAAQEREAYAAQDLIDATTALLRPCRDPRRSCPQAYRPHRSWRGGTGRGRNVSLALSALVARRHETKASLS